MPNPAFFLVDASKTMGLVKESPLQHFWRVRILQVLSHRQIFRFSLNKPSLLIV